MLQTLNEADFFSLNESYSAKHGAADFFTYGLTVQTNVNEKMVRWVDVSASEKPIPTRLIKLHEYILNIIEKTR